MTEKETTPKPDETRGIGTDLAIGLGPTVAVVTSHFLNRPHGKKDEPKK